MLTGVNVSVETLANAELTGDLLLGERLHFEPGALIAPVEPQKLRLLTSCSTDAEPLPLKEPERTSYG